MKDKLRNWLLSFKFMHDTTPQYTPEQQLAEAVLRLVEECSVLFASGGTYQSRAKGQNIRTGAQVAAHYEVWPCYEPEICFDVGILAQGAIVQ